MARWRNRNDILNFGPPRATVNPVLAVVSSGHCYPVWRDSTPIVAVVSVATVSPRYFHPGALYRDRDHRCNGTATPICIEYVACSAARPGAFPSRFALIPRIPQTVGFWRLLRGR